MDVIIYYCNLCQMYAPSAAIAAALKREFNLDTELRQGRWGTFRIEHRGDEVYNRWKTCGWMGRLGFGHTPTPEEVVAIFRARVAKG